MKSDLWIFVIDVVAYNKETLLLIIDIFYTHRSKQGQRQSSKSACGELYWPLSSHDEHSRAVLVVF